MNDLAAVEDHRLEQPEPCRVTQMVGGIEFICIAAAHGSVKSDQRDPHGRPARWRRHYFVRRYLYRDMK